MRALKPLIAVFYFVAAAIFFVIWRDGQPRPGDEESLSPYEILEEGLLRAKLRQRDTPEPAAQIAVVSFDWRATKIYGPLPWPRDVFAELIVKLRELGVKTIVMDPLFSDPQLKFLSPVAYRSLFPDLPLELIRIVNPLNYVGELRQKLEGVEGEIRARSAIDPSIAPRLARFSEQKRELLALSERISAGAASRAFEEAVFHRRDVVFPTDYSSRPKFARSSATAVKLLLSSGLDDPGGTEQIERFEHVLTLYPRLLQRRPLVGINEVEAPHLRQQRSLRRRRTPAQRTRFVEMAQLLIRFRGKLFASSISWAVAHHLGKELIVERRSDATSLRVGGRRVELAPEGAFPLAYYDDEGFPRVVSAIEVLRERVPRDALEGKLAIIDIRTEQTASFLRFSTPIHGKRWASDIKATLASNMLRGHRGPTVQRPGWVVWVEGICIWLLGGLFLLLAFRGVSLLRSLAVGLLLVAGVGAADVLLLLPARIWFGSGILVVEIPLLLIATVGAHYLIQRFERQRVRRAFGFYLPRSVLEHMLQDEGALRLGGERRNLSILFSDIRSFTSVSERADPEALGEALNVHLTELTETVFEHQGTLDKYIGDCVMAFFGAPVPDSQHALRAVRAALHMHQRLQQIQQVWREKCGSEVRIGVGVATGDVIVGNMGSKTLFDYTVIGDTVNLSSRLEGLTKVYGVQVLVAEETRKQTGDAIAYLELDLVRVKGKAKPVSIHEAICEGRPDASRELYDNHCRDGVAAFRARDWDRAAASFAQAEAARPGMRLPALYAERIARFRETPPPDDWDGVTEFDEK